MFLHFAAGLVLATSAGAVWDNHNLITSMALASAPGMDTQVPFETLEAYLGAGGFAESKENFMRRMKLNPSVDLPLVAGETQGGTLALGTILACYSDEPDWGFDSKIFQFYPELWKDDYSALGGRKLESTSTVVRHFYLVDGFFKLAFPPYSSKPLGEAPRRAQLFYEQAVIAFGSGHPYWGARFLAWSIHYVQDLAVPVHTVQIPSLSMLRLNRTLMIRLMAYYHYAFERCATEMISGQAGAKIAQRIRRSTAETGVTFEAADAEELAQMTARHSTSQVAASIGDIKEFLPVVPDLKTLDPETYVKSEAFGRMFDEAVVSRPDALFRFRGLMQVLIQDASSATRTLVDMATKESSRSADAAQAR